MSLRTIDSAGTIPSSINELPSGFNMRQWSCESCHVPPDCQGPRYSSTISNSAFSRPADWATRSLDKEVLAVRAGLEKRKVNRATRHAIYELASIFETVGVEDFAAKQGTGMGTVCAEESSIKQNSEMGTAEFEQSLVKQGMDSTDNYLPKILEILKPKDKFRYHKVPKLKALRLPLDSALVLQVLRHEDVSPTNAWKFFVWAKKQMRYKHTGETYNSMITILCEKRKFTSIYFLLEDMHKEGVSLTSETCLTMAKTFGSEGMVERAVHALNHMTQLCYPPTTRHYNSLVDVLLENEHIFKAYIAYKEMARAGCEPDAYTFKLFFKKLAKVEKMDLACHIFDDMKTRGFEPDIETSSLIIGILCQAERIDDAVTVFEKVKQKGVRMNARVYAALLNGLRKARKVDKGLEIFEEMRIRGFNLDPDLFPGDIEKDEKMQRYGNREDGLAIEEPA